MAMIERVNNELCVGYFLRRNNNNMIMTEALYVSNWYVSLGHVWGSNILKVFPYEGGELWSLGLLTIKSGEQGAPPLMV